MHIFVYHMKITNTQTRRLEVLQNRAARLVTGTPFRTSTDKLRLDLGWDTLATRRQIHKLQLYFKLKHKANTLPRYVTAAMPHTRQQDTQRSLRNSSLQSLPPNRTTLLQRSFIPSTTRAWNHLPQSMQASKSTQTFKRELLERLSVPVPPSYFTLGTKTGNILHTKLRVGMSDLNAHLYSIQKAQSPNCVCSSTPETTNHFILTCRIHAHHRAELFRNMTLILQSDFFNLPPDIKTDILLHGKNLSSEQSHIVASTFQKFIFNTKRFQR